MRSQLWPVVALTLTVAVNCGAQDQSAAQAPAGAGAPTAADPGESAEPAGAAEQARTAEPGAAETAPGDAAESNPSADVAGEPPGPAPEPEASGAPPVYQRPLAGTPGGRRSGGVRSAESCAGLQLDLLAPEGHDGWTLTDRPNLFWYLSAVPAAECAGDGFRFTLVGDAPEPLIEAELAPPTRAGVQRIQVSDYGAPLEPGSTYTWSVSLARGGASPFAQADLRYVPAGGDLVGQLEGASLGGAVRLYASQGYWYDTLEAVAAQIEAHPGDSRPASWWSSILDSQNLDVGGALP